MTSKESNFREYILENEEKILRMHRGELEGALVLADSDYATVSCSTDLPGQLDFHYRIIDWSPEKFKATLEDWFVVMRLLKRIGIPYVSTRESPHDETNLRLLRMLGLSHYGDWVDAAGKVLLNEYRIDLSCL